MAHERRPPPGYMEGARGELYAASTLRSRDGLWALTRANYAARVGPDLWMPFDTTDHRWAVDRFSASARCCGIRVSEDGLDGWHRIGHHGAPGPISHLCRVWLPVQPPSPPDAAASARSVHRTPRRMDLSDREALRTLGIRLLVDGTEAQVWRLEQLPLSTH